MKKLVLLTVLVISLLGINAQTSISLGGGLNLPVSDYGKQSGDNAELAGNGPNLFVEYNNMFSENFGGNFIVSSGANTLNFNNIYAHSNGVDITATGDDPYSFIYLMPGATFRYNINPIILETKLNAGFAYGIHPEFTLTLSSYNPYQTLDVKYMEATGSGFASRAALGFIYPFERVHVFFNAAYSSFAIEYNLVNDHPSLQDEKDTIDYSNIELNLGIAFVF